MIIQSLRIFEYACPAHTALFSQPLALKHLEADATIANFPLFPLV